MNADCVRLDLPLSPRPPPEQACAPFEIACGKRFERAELAIVNLDPYTFANDLAEDTTDENDRRSAEGVLLAAIDGTADDKLLGFAVRLALSGHRAIPRKGEPDFLPKPQPLSSPSQEERG